MRILLFLAAFFSLGAYGAPSLCPGFQKELSAIRLVPLVSDGVVKGWAMREMEKAPLLKERGLQEYDLLVRVAGQELKTAEAVRLAIAQLCSGPGRLHLVRRNKSFTLDLW